MAIAKQARVAAFLGAVVGTAGLYSPVAAQNTVVFDPAQLPVTRGRVAQYSLTPLGGVDGLILADGTEIHLPPHLGAQLVAAVRPGDAVTIHGLRAREIPMVQAAQVTNDASGATVADNGPGMPGRDAPPRPASPAPMDAQGTVKIQLHGPLGDLNGVLLHDGTILRLPPPEAQRRAAALVIGAPIVARGNGLASPLGRVISVTAMGRTAQDLTAINVPPLARRLGPGPRGLGPPN